MAGALILGGIVTLIVFAVRNQWGALVVAAGDGLDELQGLLVEGPIALNSEQFNAVRDAIVGFVTSAQFGTGALAGVSAAVELVTGALLVLVILFFFLKDGGQIWNFFLRFLMARASSAPTGSATSPRRFSASTCGERRSSPSSTPF
ncbi:AI-2E family transporter [Cryobacterium sp. TMT2-14]|uniref:AI-2E family transporter n=1 Tax=Cryobacterium sp. TMT2-14 TaxID=1259245 RepID=UPI00106B96A7|nr:AI-2E family transporter [Cryobacterium sp. TMT2-14]TFC33641.1 AI-2E family transporter [Cryobacterium sp. TMT2-14]